MLWFYVFCLCIVYGSINILNHLFIQIIYHLNLHIIHQLIYLLIVLMHHQHLDLKHNIIMVNINLFNENSNILSGHNNNEFLILYYIY